MKEKENWIKFFFKEVSVKEFQKGGINLETVTFYRYHHLRIDNSINWFEGNFLYVNYRSEFDLGNFFSILSLWFLHKE